MFSLTHTHGRRMMIALGLLAALVAAPAHAQDFALITEGIEGCDFVTGILDVTCIPNFIGFLVKMIFGATGMIFMVNVMVGGYQLAISGVTEDKASGKNRIMYSIIGFIVCACSFLIVDFVISALING
ncbi:MAG: hypothetical protein KBC95_02830 [Candidatus Peribacteraceae bacterium]|nr:hypothetical protein [Candidatus Peribacteraceae bacterium]